MALRLLDGIDTIYSMILHQQVQIESHDNTFQQLGPQLDQHLKALYTNDLAIRDALHAADEHMAICQRVIDDQWTGTPYLTWINGEEWHCYENGQRPIDWMRYRAEYREAVAARQAALVAQQAAQAAPAPEAPQEPAFDPEAGAAIFGD